LYYNGDITSVAKFHEMQERYPSIDRMIGRGLISDPFLPSMIKIILGISTNKWNYVRFMIHCMLFQRILSGSTHILLKMYHLWEYFSVTFANPHKVLKKLKSTKYSEL
jgi:tRNA-dihydrouridine synthase